MGKKLLSIIFLMLALMCVLASCNDSNKNTHTHTHSYGEWETVKNPTCTTKGRKERICSCGEKESESISTLEHSYGEWIIIEESTCSQKGSRKRVCICGEALIEELKLKEHTLDTHDFCTTCNQQWLSLTNEEKELAEKIKYMANSKVYSDPLDGFILEFNLQDENSKTLSVSALVDLRIEDENGNVVYEKTTIARYSEGCNGIRINPYLIKKGTAKLEKIYFKISVPGYASFEEDYHFVPAILWIPNNEASFDYEVEVYDAKLEGSITGYKLTLTLRPWLSPPSSFYINYKVFDSAGTCVENKIIYCYHYERMEFHLEKNSLYNLESGEIYRLEFELD